jgi:hemoglobin-like flavoprotein
MTLRAIVGSLEQPESITARLADLGADHVAFGARPDDYKVFGESLMATLQLQLGHEWTPETEQAWRELYRMITERMLEGATATVR